MTKDELIKLLEENAIDHGDVEVAHSRCDQALLDFIDDERVIKAFRSGTKWYA